MIVNQTREIDWNYDELYLLREEIDTLLDRTGYEDEALWQEQVRDRIKGLATSLGIHIEILQTYSQHCKDSGFVLTTK